MDEYPANEAVFEAVMRKERMCLFVIEETIKAASIASSLGIFYGVLVVLFGG